jgi:hypothetical protein
LEVAGYAAGRPLDKRMPNAQDYGGMLSLSSPRGRGIYKEILEKVGGKSAAESDILLKLLEAKGVQNYVKPDGTSRGYIEGFLGGLGRKYGDNVVQGGVAFATPFILNQQESEAIRLEDIVD